MTLSWKRQFLGVLLATLAALYLGFLLLATVLSAGDFSFVEFNEHFFARNVYLLLTGFPLFIAAYLFSNFLKHFSICSKWKAMALSIGFGVLSSAIGLLAICIIVEGGKFQDVLDSILNEVPWQWALMMGFPSAICGWIYWAIAIKGQQDRAVT